MNIFLAPHPTEGFNYFWTCPRGEAIVRQGLAKLPEVRIVDSEMEADFVFWDYVPHNREVKTRELIDQYDPDKLVVIDWVDEFDWMHTDRFFAYFKRSWVYPQNPVNSPGVNPYKYVVQRPTNMFPFAYAVMDEFLQRAATHKKPRNIDFACYLRPTCPNRIEALQTSLTVAKNLHAVGKRVHVGPVNEASRSVGANTYFDPTYFDALSRTKIVVTCNPTWWEGDSRTWEALAASCLVFVDLMSTPLPNPLKSYEHLINYFPTLPHWMSNDIFYYAKHEDEAAEIAKKGRDWAIQYHSSEARMRYVIDTLKRLKANA